MHTKDDRGTGIIETNGQFYLQCLSQNAPTSTYNSHKASIRPFINFCELRGITLDCLDVAHVREFVETRFGSNAVETIKGHVDSLANFLGYVWRTDPAVVKTQIYHSVDAPSAEDEVMLCDLPAAASPSLNADDERLTAVEMLIDYLRKRHYGNRTHAYVELIIATASQPSVVRQLDVDDFDRDESRITIVIPESHAVSANGLLRERTVDLSSQAGEALGLYLDHEHVSVANDDRDPLFTTASGRVDESTVWRAIKKVSKKSLTTPVTRSTTDSTAIESTDDDPIQTVTPSDIWRYSLTQY